MELNRQKVIHLDPRRRVSLAKVGRKEHSRYIVTEHPDGVVELTPAVLVPVVAQDLCADGRHEFGTLTEYKQRCRCGKAVAS